MKTVQSLLLSDGGEEILLPSEPDHSELMLYVANIILQCLMIKCSNAHAQQQEARTGGVAAALYLRDVVHII